MRIETKELKAVLGGNEILKGVDFTAEGQKVIGVIGPNGSGKSTLLKCIYRVLKPSGGAVYLDSTPIQKLPVRQTAQKIAVVAQHNYYNFEFTVQDNADDFHIVSESLATVGMQEMAGRIFSTLSGGEQQRVILARALAQQTPCLILDEPTNHLDIQHQLQMMELVRGLNRTVITAVHDLNIAAMYCDELYAVLDGNIVGHGTPETLLTPDFIRQVYHVEACVLTDEDGVLRILYRPAACIRRKEPR